MFFGSLWFGRRLLDGSILGLGGRLGGLLRGLGGSFGGQSYAVADAAEAAALVPELLEPGDVVLVKASRGVGLELVSESVIESEG